MRRGAFLRSGGLLALSTLVPMRGLSALQELEKHLTPSGRMPVLFIGHGNPMNAIEDNVYHKSWEQLGKALPRPQAILSISAHWVTEGTGVTAMPHPRTIHDFSGFPPELFAQQYPAPGTPELARLTQQLITQSHVHADELWGLDHGTWSVLL